MPPILERFSTDEQPRAEESISAAELVYNLESLVTNYLEILASRIESLVIKHSIPTSRSKSEKAPFQIGYKERDINWKCSYLSTSFNVEIKHELLYCKLDEHIEEYRKSGSILLRCDSCKFNITEHDSTLQTLIHIFKQ